MTEDLQAQGKAKRLAAFEIPRKALLDSDPWTPESGLVTDALKIKRYAIKSKFIDEIKRMYGH